MQRWLVVQAAGAAGVQRGRERQAGQAVVQQMQPLAHQAGAKGLPASWVWAAIGQGAPCSRSDGQQQEAAAQLLAAV